MCVREREGGRERKREKERERRETARARERETEGSFANTVAGCTLLRTGRKREAHTCLKGCQGVLARHIPAGRYPFTTDTASTTTSNRCVCVPAMVAAPGHRWASSTEPKGRTARVKRYARQPSSRYPPVACGDALCARDTHAVETIVTPHKYPTNRPTFVC